MSIQFPLQLEIQSNQGFDAFLPASNQEVVARLKQFADSGNENQIFLYGAQGQGKSHLLQACCQLAYQKDMNSFYYPFNARNLPTLAMFEGLENVKLVCFDDIDQIAGYLDWEQTLSNFLNQHLDNHNLLLLASRKMPEEMDLKLPDLKKRLNSCIFLKLDPLTEDEIIEALIHKANYMGITISYKVGRFLVTHYASDMPSMWVLLSQLDKATLSAQRKLTIPFLKQILE